MTFWDGKNVLVTGGGGFIGSHVTEQLAASGAHVTATVRDPMRNHFIQHLANDITIHPIDLMHANECHRIIAQQDVVLHLAARVGGIEYNMAHPGSIFRHNLQIFMNVLEAARAAGTDRFLTVSSACVYPRHCSIPTPEEEGFAGTPEPTNEGYGWAKRMEEFLSEAYAKEYGMRIALARPYNAYGPRDNFDPASSHVIPALIHRVVSGENPLRVWGSGNQTRSFLFVEDFARGLLRTAEKQTTPEPINLGSDEETTIRQVVDHIVDLTGISPKIEYDTTKPEGQPRRACDTRKAKKVLGFTATTPLRDGLRATIDWYQRHA